MCCFADLLRNVIHEHKLKNHEESLNTTTQNKQYHIDSIEIYFIILKTLIIKCTKSFKIWTVWKRSPVML